MSDSLAPAAGATVGADLVVGVGCRRHTSPAQLHAHLLSVLGDHGLAVESVTALVTLDSKVDDGAVPALASTLGVPLRTHPAAALDGIEVPTPSGVVAEAAGTRSVAEACVLLESARMIVPKQVGPRSTIAIGRLRWAPDGTSGVVDDMPETDRTREST